MMNLNQGQTSWKAPAKMKSADAWRRFCRSCSSTQQIICNTQAFCPAKKALLSTLRMVCRRGASFILQKCWENFATTSPKERKMDLKRGNHMTPNSAWLLDFGKGQMVGASKENPGENRKNLRLDAAFCSVRGSLRRWEELAV